MFSCRMCTPVCRRKHEGDYSCAYISALIGPWGKEGQHQSLSGEGALLISWPEGVGGGTLSLSSGPHGPKGQGFPTKQGPPSMPSPGQKCGFHLEQIRTFCTQDTFQPGFALTYLELYVHFCLPSISSSSETQKGRRVWLTGISKPP